MLAINRTLAVIVALAVAIVGCGEARPQVDDRPPPYLDRGGSIHWSTSEVGVPSDDWVTEMILEYRLPMLLVPVSDVEADMSLSFSRAGWDVVVQTTATGADAPTLRVRTSNFGNTIECDPSSQITIRDTAGCFVVEGPGNLLLVWDEGWQQQARWTQPTSDPTGEYVDYYLAWLGSWVAHSR